MEREILNFLKKYIKKGDYVLDVGCGDGKFLDKVIYTLSVSGIGIDANMKMKPQCFRMKAEEIDKLDKIFDVIYTKNSLHHFEDIEKFIKKAYNRLKVGGYLLIVDYKEGAYTGVLESYLNPFKVKDLIPKWALFKELEFFIFKDSFFIAFKKILPEFE